MLQASVRITDTGTLPTVTPIANRIVVARVFVDGQLTANVSVPGGSSTRLVTDFGATAFGGASIMYAATSGVSGPFLISPPSNAQGNTTIDFVVSGLTPSPAQEVRLVIEGLCQDLSIPPGSTPVKVSSMVEWNMPATLAENRSIAD